METRTRKAKVGAGRPLLPINRRMSEMMCLPMTKDLYNSIKKEADELGLNPQAYIRQILAAVVID